MDMLDGDVEKCMTDLRSSIECGRKWKKIYERTASVINKRAALNKGQMSESGKNPGKWDFNPNSIFA